MNEQDNSSFIKVLLAALIIISMLVINLYLLACLVNMLGSNVFSNNPNCFDLFYYTVVSFITLGSSDIIPLSVTAKLITILISFSSFYCISLFLGVLYSHSKK